MATQVTKILDDAVLEVRMILNDLQVPYRYADASVLQVLNTVIREAYRIRPDLYIGNFTSGILSANLANTYTTLDLQSAPIPPVPATPFPLDDRLAFGPCVFYIAGRLEISDDEFADSGRAVQLMQAFRAQLIGDGG